MFIRALLTASGYTSYTSAICRRLLVLCCSMRLGKSRGDSLLPPRVLAKQLGATTRKMSRNSSQVRPRGDLDSYLQYLEISLFPVYTPAILVVKSKRKLPSSLWPELAEQHKTKSLRQLANEYGVSYESVRRTIARAKSTTLDEKLFED